jgi:hypothetical protein
MFPSISALLRKVGRLEAERHACEAAWNVPPPPGLDAAGARLWAEWTADLAATTDAHVREVKRTAMQCMDAETVAIAARVRSGG